MGLFCLLPEGGGGRSSQIARKSLISTFQVELSLRGAESLWIPTWSNFDNAELLSTLQVPIAANNHVFAVFEKQMWTLVYLQKREEELSMFATKGARMSWICLWYTNCDLYFLLFITTRLRYRMFRSYSCFQKKMFCGHRGQILQKSLARGNPTPFFGNASILGTFGHTLVILAVTHAKKINFSSFRVSSADNSSWLCMFHN